MTMDEQRLARLEERVGRLEDELAITRLVASYGPLVDAGEAEGVAGLWAQDGAYDVEGWQMTSREDIRAMVEPSCATSHSSTSPIAGTSPRAGASRSFRPTRQSPSGP